MLIAFIFLIQAKLKWSELVNYIFAPKVNLTYFSLILKTICGIPF